MIVILWSINCKIIFTRSSLSSRNVSLSAKIICWLNYWFKMTLFKNKLNKKKGFTLKTYKKSSKLIMKWSNSAWIKKMRHLMWLIQIIAKLPLKMLLKLVRLTSMKSSVFFQMIKNLITILLMANSPAAKSWQKWNMILKLTHKIKMSMIAQIKTSLIMVMIKINTRISKTNLSLQKWKKKNGNN